ncbi:MAG: histidine phosphatase family protein [Rhizobiaceae bacterium]|nr:histidine phosphatase family protein [Rhizobiaceae bacterium]
MARFTAPHPYFLIRHGQTDWNAEGRFQGSVDIPLNDIGRGQAAGNGVKLKSVLGDAAGWRFLSSPLSRARETMEIVRRAAGYSPVDAYGVDPLLAEVTYGDWERRTIPELEAESPALVAARAADKWGFVPPNGESYGMLAERVRSVLSGLTGPTVITAHGGVLRSVYHLTGGMGGDEAANADVPQDRFLFVEGTTLSWM